MIRRLLTRRRLFFVGLAFLGMGLFAPHAWAWYQLRNAQKALAHYRPEEARRAIDQCRKVWG